MYDPNQFVGLEEHTCEINGVTYYFRELNGHESMAYMGRAHLEGSNAATEARDLCVSALLRWEGEKAPACPEDPGDRVELLRANIIMIIAAAIIEKSQVGAEDLGNSSGRSRSSSSSRSGSTGAAGARRAAGSRGTSGQSRGKK